MKSLMLTAVLMLGLAAEPAQVRVPYDRPLHRDAMLIPARVNGRSATLLLDTGAAHTVLSVNVMHPEQPRLSESRFLGAGLRGEAMWDTVDLQIGTRRWRDRRVVVMNLSAVSRVYGRPIDGLLGMDFVNEFDQVVIDRNRQIMAFEKGVSSLCGD
jgi:hypothetical protein